jgi:hypothetical protein
MRLRIAWPMPVLIFVTTMEAPEDAENLILISRIDTDAVILHRKTQFALFLLAEIRICGAWTVKGNLQCVDRRAL